jgi:hypothetical protein
MDGPFNIFYGNSFKGTFTGWIDPFPAQKYIKTQLKLQLAFEVLRTHPIKAILLVSQSL